MEEKKYSQEEQVEIVRDAMILTATIEYEEKELSKIKKSMFKALPEAPKRVVAKARTIKAQIPPKPTIPYEVYKKQNGGYNVEIGIGCGILLVLIIIFVASTSSSDSLDSAMGLVSALPIIFILFIAGCIIFSKLINRKQKILENGYKNYLIQLENHPAYQNMVSAAIQQAELQLKAENEAVSNKQKELDAEYAKEKEQYEMVIVPNYNQELAVWNDNKNKSIAFYQEEIAYNKDALDNLYDVTKKISSKYRELWILKWLYEDMSTSDHSIEYATELLDRDRQRAATEKAGTQVSNAINDLQGSLHKELGYIYSAIENNNASLENLHDELHQMRNDNNKAQLAGVYQRWSIKRELKKMKQ